MADVVLDTPESFVAMVFEAASAEPWRTLEANLGKLPRPSEMASLQDLFDDVEARARFHRYLKPLLPASRIKDLKTELAAVPLWPRQAGYLNVRLSGREEVPSLPAIAFARACEKLAQTYMQKWAPGSRAVLVDVVAGSATFRLRLDAIAEGALAGLVSGIAVLMLTAFGSSSAGDQSNAALQREVMRLHRVCVELAKQGNVDALACYTEYGHAGSVAASDIAPRDSAAGAVVSRCVRIQPIRISAKGSFLKYGGGYFFKDSKGQHISRVIGRGDSVYQERVLYRISGTQMIHDGERLVRIDVAERVNPPRVRRNMGDRHNSVDHEPGGLDEGDTDS